MKKSETKPARKTSKSTTDAAHRIPRRPRKDSGLIRGIEHNLPSGLIRGIEHKPKPD